MKIANLMTFVIASLMFFSACNNDELNDIKAPSVEAGEGYMTVKLKDASGFTKSDGEDEGTAEERAINELEFYVFDANGNHNKEKDYFKFDPNTNNQYTFPVTTGSDITVLVAANLQLGKLDGNLNAIKATLHERAFNNPLEFSTEAGIPMSGEESEIEVGEEDVKIISISLSRLYSKISAPTAVGTNVSITLSQEIAKLDSLLGDIQGQVRFNLNAHVVVNGLKKSFAFQNYGTEEESRWNPTVWTIGNSLTNYTASTYNSEGKLESAYSGNDFLTQNESVFVYENSPLRTVDENDFMGYAPKTVYALIIEGELYDSANPANSVTRYWRINVSKTGETDSMYKILRNAIYNVNIQNVKTVGYGTPKEAEEEKPIIPDVDQSAIVAKISVAPWRIFNENQDI